MWVREEGDPMKDNEIVSNIKLALDHIQKGDEENIKIGSKLINDCHVLIYELCQVSRDLELVIAHEIFTITNNVMIGSDQYLSSSINSAFHAISDLVQDHLEYYG